MSTDRVRLDDVRDVLERYGMPEREMRDVVKELRQAAGEELMASRLRHRGTTGRPMEVPAEWCEEWRRRVREGGESGRRIAEETRFDGNTVNRHVRGDCAHEHVEEPPVNRRRGGV